jgi:hypothetical protein
VLDGASSAAVSAVSLVSDADAPWVLRSLDVENPDEVDALGYLLGVSYCRSRAGKRAGAERAGRPGQTPNSDSIAKQKAFLAAMSGIWKWLFENATTTLAVDPEHPHIIVGWCITSEPNVVHAVGVKRSFCLDDHTKDPVAVDIVQDLLGPRLGEHQVCSLELPQMARFGHGNTGVDRPRDWSLDPTWLLLRMGTR